MVIQRSWKILSETGSTSASSTEANRSLSGLNSSSDDSNCSNQTTHSMITSVASPLASNLKPDTPNTLTSSSYSIEPEKFVTTPQMAERLLQKLRQRYVCTASNNISTAESVMRSLELVRIAVQASFDMEIDALIRKFIENFFKPALQNIKENLCQSAISEEMLQKMSCALLENAKTQYKIYRLKPQNSTSVINTHIINAQDNIIRAGMKRTASGKPNSTSIIQMQKRFFPENLVIQNSQSMNVNMNLVTGNQMTGVCNSVVGNYTGDAMSSKSTACIQPVRRQIFWNTAHISTTTKFVLDVQANQAFGFGTDGKERLASKHPELIRYLPDNDDRDWLIAQQIIPQQNRNSRFLFLIYDEVCRLHQTHEVYRRKPNVDLSVMMTFTVADFIIKKMKVFFVDLNIKSRGLITNSYSVEGSTAITNSSHLRNALLQGAQATTTKVVKTNSATNSTQIATATTTTVNSSITANELPSTQKTKSSMLSSSHATLTALLNNSSSTGKSAVI